MYTSACDTDGAFTEVLQAGHTSVVLAWPPSRGALAGGAAAASPLDELLLLAADMAGLVDGELCV